VSWCSIAGCGCVFGPGLGDGGNGCLLSVRLSIRKISASFQSMSVTGARVQQPPGSVDGVTRGGSTQICYTVKWLRTCTESICRCIAFISFTTLPLPWPCVCPSVRPSQVGVLLKRLNIGSYKQHYTIAQGL